MNARGLVINLGLKSVRAIVFDQSGRKLSAASRPISTFVRNTWIEQDANEWWEKAVVATREALGNRAIRSVDFVTATASAACLLPVDASGRPLRPAIMVSDRRSMEQAEALAALPTFEAVRRTNAAFGADPYFLAPKACWIKASEPEVYATTRWMMTPGDFFILRLSGEPVTDPLNAEKFFYDVSGECYPQGFMEEAGLEMTHLLPVAAVGQRVGSLTREAATTLGLPVETPVVLSTYDAICAFWGSGACDHGDVVDVSGTVTSVRVLSDKLIEAQENRVFTQSMPGTNWHIVGGSNNLGGGLIEWLKQSFYAVDPQPYETMEAEAETSGAGARGILFLPYLLGERSPIWNPNARGVFFGLERHHERGDFARAVLESSAFGVEHILRVLRLHGITPGRLRVSGGLARLRLISLIKADVTGLQTEVLEEFESTALGAFMLAGVGCGIFPNLEEATAIVRVREVILPNAERGVLYGEWFGLYLRLYEDLCPLFDERHRLYRKHDLTGAGRLENL